MKNAKKRYCTAVCRLAAICLALAMTFPVIAYATEPAEISRETAQSLRENPQLSVQSAKTKLKLNKSSATILVGEKVALKATVTGKKGTVKWSSSKKSVATVSSKGVVTGKKKGTATITAKVNGVKKTCKVTVKAVPNVTDSVLKKKPADAAKYLGLTQKSKYYNPDYELYEYYYIRKGKKLFDGSPRLEYLNSTSKYGGYWDLFIEDKSITFQGVKVGMSVSQAKEHLKKKWKLAAKYEDMLIYHRNMNFSFTWDGGVDLLLYVKKGKVTSMKYLTIEW